jgi:anti-sigma B factor antagonist
VRNFRLIVDEQDDVVSMALVGELDMAEIEAFEGELERVEAGHPGTLVLDLSELVLIDSHGLSALLDAEARARAQGRRLVLVPPPDQVMQVFRITLLDQRFVWLDEDVSPSVFPEVSAAVGRLRRRVAEPAD